MSSNSVEAGRYGSGREVRRIEDPALLRGEGRFTDDLVREGQTHLVFLRSPYAHARIVGVDTSAAKAVPGVLAVFSGAELHAAGVQPIGPAVPFPRPDGTPGASAPRHPLALDRVRYVGEAVAAVVAESREGYRALFSWNELFNTAVGDGVLVAWHVDEAPLPEGAGPFALVSLHDRATGPRYERIFGELGAGRVTSLDFDTRRDCEEPGRLDVLQRATGVFFNTAVLDYRLYRQIFPAWALARHLGREA